MAGLSVMVCVAVGPGVARAAGVDAELSAPHTAVIALYPSSTLAKFSPVAQQPIADGDDWLEFAPVATSYSNSDGAPEAFALADPETGRVQEVSLPRGLQVGTPLSLGPDGNVWFAAQNQRGDIVLGQLSAGAQLHLLVPKTAVPGQPMGVASGSDGALWVMSTTQRHVTRLTRVNIQTGQARTYGLARSSLPLGLMLPAVGGGFWVDLAAGRHPAMLERIDTQGQVISRIQAALTPATLDEDGAVWGPDRAAGGDLERVRAGGQVSQVTWYPPQPDRAAGVESAALGSDGQVWFTGESAVPLAAAEDQDPEIQDVIGVSGPDLGVQTWPTAFTNPGMDPTFPQDGVNYLYPPLAAAPDGRLDAIEYLPSINRIWDLLSVTLPDQPVMHPATVRLLHASARGRRVAVRLSCSGQAGRVCDGTISVKLHAHTIARQTYGLAPGLQSTHTLVLPSGAVVTGVSVTSVDPLAHQIQTQSLELP